MLLYEFGPSRSIRVKWTLAELGLDCETVTVNLFADDHRRAEFLSINPAGKLPVLVDGGLVMTESVAIVLYLAGKDPRSGLLPADPRQRAQLDRWLFFTVTELEQPLWRIRRHTAIYPADRRLPADVALAAEEFAAMARVVEAHIEDRAFVVGDAMTVGDVVLAHTLDWAKTAGMLNDLPALNAYVERMYARPHAPPRLAAALANAMEPGRS
jgi:glutathione S-transferase